MASCPDSDGVYRQLVTMDATLLDDAMKLGSSDTLQLSRRLEAAVKLLSQSQGCLSLESPGVCDYARQAVHCYVSASETAKVARGLEKLLIATGPPCQELIKTVLHEKLQEILQRSTTKDLQKVSSILEQSQMVQEVTPKLLPSLLKRLDDLFAEFSNLTPSHLSRDELDKVCITVKLSLQLFQCFPDVKQSLWKSDVTLFEHISQYLGSSDVIQDSLKNVVSGIAMILVSKAWPREVTLLAGTAAVMIVNSAPFPEQAVECFFSLYSSVCIGCLSLQVGAMHLSTDAETAAQRSSGEPDNRTPEIALLRSMISSASEDVLCCVMRCAVAGSPLPKTSAELNSDTAAESSAKMTSGLPPVFLLRLFPFICELCDSGTDFQYLSFHLMSLWYKKLALCLPVLTKHGKKITLMGKGSIILDESLSRLWVSWDSPVDGVTEFVVETFRLMLEIWHSEVSTGLSDYSKLAEELMMRVMQRPWYDRSRYKPLALLVPFVDRDKLLHDHSTLRSELQQCMGASFLAALATDVYSAFLHSIRKQCPEEQQAEKWWEAWGLCMVSGLTSSDSLVRQKICAYWLPVTLKTLPTSGQMLREHLEDLLRKGAISEAEHQTLLYAWVTACKHMRSLLGLDITSLAETLLVEVVHSDDEDLVAQGLSLLCGTHKKAEPLKDVEMRLLRSSLPYCLKVDLAPFRQELITSLKKLFVRVRDSCSTAIKKKTDADFIDPSVQFMDWLYNLAVFNLFPGASFQRRRTCLDIIQAWFETVIFVQADQAKKGKAQGPTDILLEYARSKGQWDLFSASNRISLLYCVTDGADEVQDSALHILGKYFPWSGEEARLSNCSSASHAPTTSSPSGTNCSVCSDDFAIHLLHHGLTLCNSPRAYENHSGALLVRLVFDKYVRQQGYHFQVSMDEQTAALTITQLTDADSSGRGEDCAAFFNQVLIKLLSLSLQAAERDALTASRLYPMHGIMQAFCECLRLEQQSGLVSGEDLMNILQTAISLSTTIVTLMLNFLSGGQTEGCPSFAEMGIALDQLVAAESSSDQDLASSLSPEFQLMLSWCWLNLKESCTCLGEAVAAGMKVDVDSSERLTAETVEVVRDAFLKVLSNCRHRGAIEGCRNGFSQFCVSLMKSGDKAVASIPANILQQLFVSLEKDEMTSSVTRRSAGLPIIVQTVAQAERKCKSNRLLQESVRKLYAIASRPVRDCHDQTQDQASVHALNVLKSIFSDASMAGDLLSHLGNAVQLVIESFESPSWAVRNAATQFVSTLVTRMFGQRNKVSLSCNTLTLQEFSARFPQLLAFVSQKLEASLREKGGIAEVQPSLFLTLTLLSSLGPAADLASCHRLTTKLHNQVLTVMASPVYYLRQLAATAAVALTPLDTTERFVAGLFTRFGTGAKLHNSNYIHGTLLCLEKLLASRSVSAQTAEKIIQFMLSNRWLLSADMTCPFVSAKCVDVLHKVVSHPHLPEGNPHTAQLSNVLRDILSAPAPEGLQVGESLLKSSIVSLVVTILQSEAPETVSALHEFCVHCLHSEDVEIRSAILQHFPLKAVCMRDSAIYSESTNISACLWKTLDEETDPWCAIKAAKILTTLRIEEPYLTEPLDRFMRRAYLDPCRDMIALRSRFHQLAGVQAALFPVEALIIERQLMMTEEGVPTGLNEALLYDWSERLPTYSGPYQNEDFRMAAAQGLHIAGPAILDYYKSTEDFTQESTVVRLLKTCLTLLEETDSDIRKLAAQFVGHLQWEKKYPQVNDINCNLCLKVLMSYIHDELKWSRGVWDFLLNKLYTPAELSTCLQKRLEPRSHYLFEHEENTFFSERILQQKAIFEILMKMCKLYDGQPDYVVVALSVLISELRACVMVIETHTADLSVYNMWGERAVMISLTGLAYQACVFSRCLALAPSKPQVGADLPEQLSEELKRVCTIPNIHPALSSFLRCASQQLNC